MVAEDDKIEQFQQFENVSRETLQKFDVYLRLLREWQAKINLVASSTLDQAWSRHFLDSAQLLPFLHSVEGKIYDIGSGAGFPGMVLAILGRPRVVLVERDQRKCAFLRSVAMEVDVQVKIETRDALTLSVDRESAITARAVAPLNKLVPIFSRISLPDTHILLLRGFRAQDELTEMRKSWSIEAELHPSKTDPEGRIVLIRHLSRKLPHERS